MKKVILLFALVFVITSCEQSGSKNQRILSKSSGKINNLQVVVDNGLWEGSVGEKIRSILAAPVNGLPQDEPLFSMQQMPPSIFSDFATKSRIILKIEKGNEASIKYAKNVFAKPQRIVVVSGKTNQEINKVLEDNASKIVSVFKTAEITEKQKRIKISLNTTGVIEKTFGATMKFPSVYRVAKAQDDFVWLRKDIKTGTVNLMIYQMPLEAISKEGNTISDIISIRDSVGKIHIPGPTEGSYMITEEAYTPSLYKTIIDNKSAFQTRSTWEVKNAFMAGPFLNYAIEDAINNRYLIIEGFAFAPSVNKRDYMFELEAIIRSLEIK
jgi:hypothetical protein